MWQLASRFLTLPMAACTISGFYSCRYILNCIDQPMEETILEHITFDITKLVQNFLQELNICYEYFTLDPKTNLNECVILDGTTLTAIAVLSILESTFIVLTFMWVRDWLNKPTDEEILRSILNDINELASILRTVEELTDEAYNAFNKAIEVLEKEIQNILPWNHQERNLRRFAWERLTLCRRLFTPLASRYALVDRHMIN